MMLLDKYVAAGIDIADSICPAPMTKTTLKDARDTFGDKITIWGGIPSIATLKESESDKEFYKIVDDTLETIGRGDHFIMSVADPFSVRCGLAERVKEYAKGRILAIASDVEPNPTCDNVDACAKKAREMGARAIVALGGGSSMDCAKSTAAAVAMGCSGMELLKGKPITEALPLVAIPTTAGTGSEVGWGAVLSNHATNEKIAIFGNPIFPKIALVDPELTYTVPPAVTASTGIDVIAHSLDAMCSVRHNPVSDALACELGGQRGDYRDLDTGMTGDVYYSPGRSGRSSKRKREGQKSGFPFSFYDFD